MPTLVKTQCVYERTTAIAADNQSNTFYVYSDELDAETVANDAQGAWGSVVEGGFVFGYMEHMSPNLFTGSIMLNSFDMSDPEPRVPILSQVFEHTPSGGAAILPPEVSMVMSFQAVRASGEPQARRRGRLYLPTPANEIAVSGGRVNFDNTFVDLVTDLASGFKANLLGVDCSWAVFSPTIFAIDESIVAASALVENGWIDVEPDIQRRRGNASGVKHPFT